MSLHLINNVKDQPRQQNPDNLPSPVLTGNPSRPTYLATNATTRRQPSNRKNRPHRVGEAAYMETTHNRQRPFFHKLRNYRQNPHTAWVLTRNFSVSPHHSARITRAESRHKHPLPGPSRMRERGLVTKKPRSLHCGAFWFALESRLSGAGYPRSPAAFRTGGTAAGWTGSIPASWRLRPSSWGQPSCRPRRHRRCSRRRSPATRP